ncbi:hypothetical protein LINGRAHAP2_LOCUS1611 [Linum grandiflorum]
MSQVIYGYQERHKEMRDKILQQITDYWGPFEKFYGQAQDVVKKRLKWESDVWCSEAHWMHLEDIFVFSTIYNCAIVVYTTDSKGVPFGQTILHVTTLDGMPAPELVIYIVNTGNHWMR